MRIGLNPTHTEYTVLKGRPLISTASLRFGKKLSTILEIRVVVVELLLTGLKRYIKISKIINQINKSMVKNSILLFIGPNG